MSSGLRINTAADDPSGLGISTRLQTQVNGLDQGVQSVQDATNALNVADGSLSDISSILLRIRDLVVQATSDLKSASDKADIQTEITQLTQEINTISQNTSFNGQTLLDGSLSSKSPLPAQILTPTNSGLGAGGTLLDSTVDPSQPSINPNGPQFSQTLTVESYDPTTNLLTVQAQIGGADPSFGPEQTATFQVLAGTNYAVGDFPPTPGNPEFTQSAQNGAGQPVLSFNIGTLSASDVGATATVVTIPAQTKAPGQAVQVNLGSTEGDVVSVDIPAVNANNLAVNDITIGDNFTNVAAEYRVDYGIQTLANYRAQIGAQTVSLQQSATDASNAAVNLQASESLIADTNIGQTESDLVRQQILTSVQNSVLSRLYGVAPEVVALVQGSIS